MRIQTRYIIAALLISWASVLVAQQGTTVIKDGASATQASVKAAGTSGTNALSVQGVTGGIPIPTSPGTGSTTSVNIASFGAVAVVAANTPGLMTTAPAAVEVGTPTTTASTYRSLSMNSSGAIRTDATTVGGVAAIASTPTSGQLVVAPAVVETSTPSPTQGQYRSASMTLSGAIRTDDTTFGNTAVVIAGTPGLTTTAGGVVENTAPSVSQGTYRALSLTTSAAARVAEVNPITNNVTDSNIGYATVSVTGPGTTELVALSGTKTVYVTAMGLTVATTTATAQTFQIVYGTGSACGTGQTVITGAYSGGTVAAALSGTELPTVITIGNGMGMLFKGAAGNAICIRTSGSQQISGFITYVQFFYQWRRQAPDAESIEPQPVWAIWHPHRHPTVWS